MTNNIQPNKKSSEKKCKLNCWGPRPFCAHEDSSLHDKTCYASLDSATRKRYSGVDVGCPGVPQPYCEMNKSPKASWEEEYEKMFRGAWNDYFSPEGEIPPRVVVQDFIRQLLERAREEERGKARHASDIRVAEAIRSACKTTLDEVSKMVEGMKRKTNDLETEERHCLFMNHNPVWDGNWFTCSRCGIEFLPAERINQALSDLLAKLKELKNI